MQEALAQAASERLHENRLTLPEVVLIAMHAVEIYAKRVREVHGQQKLQLAREQIPEVIKFAVDKGYCDVETANALQHRLETSVDVVIHMIETLHAVATNPALVQAATAVRQTCCPLVARK